MRGWVVVRMSAVALFVVGLFALNAAPASAHTISGPRPTNYRSRVVAIAPAVPGITARVVDLGAKLELTNRSTSEITVLGYEGEPYLRIGPNGVFENLHSQATYINRTRQGGSVPSDIDTSPTAAPDWKKISSGHSTSWHDHRIHWMQSQLPPAVARAPGSFQHLSTQNVVFTLNGEAHRIAVALDWVPGPSGLPWIPVIVVLFAVGLGGALLVKSWRVFALLVAVLVISDIAHAVGFEIPRPGANPTKFVQFLGGSFVSIAVWIAAVPTVVALLRKRIEALYGVLFVGLMVALIGGATDASALWKSQLPDAGPAWLTRVEVAIALGLGAGLVLGALVRMTRTRAVSRDDGRGQWLSLLVSGLSDAELASIVRELDADEVLEVAIRELAQRVQPIGATLADGSVTFVVTDQAAPVVWSLTRADSAGVRSARGAVEPVAAEIRAPFSVMLQLLAGTRRLDDARDSGAAITTGDAALLARLAPYLPESSATSAS